MYNAKFLENYNKQDLHFSKQKLENKKQEIISYMNDMKPTITLNGNSNTN